MSRNQARSMRGVSLVSAAALAALAAPSRAQERSRTPVTGLEEIIVTATRVETNLQQTPLSIRAFSGAELELAGIDAGRDLSIMVPNVVINPGCCGEFATATFIRGLPGVTTYVDGVNFYNVGFLQRSFVEIERVEVLRGPQGTLFGRNTNGGAVHIITRGPAEQFGARLDLEVGEFAQRTLALAVDMPLGERLRSKWTAARDQNDGFQESRTAAFALGDFDNTVLRADFLWEPTSRLSLRFNVNEENRHGSPARVLRISNPQHPAYVAYNVLAGNPEYLARARAMNPAFPSPPFALPFDRFTPETHQQGYAGGGLGEWETRSDTPGPTQIDQRFATVTLNWEIGSRWSLESLTAHLDSRGAQIAAYDASEFTVLTEMSHDHYQGTTQELHLVGHHFEGRLQSLLGVYYNGNSVRQRPGSWWFWEFAVPNRGPNPGTAGPPGVGGRPLVNLAARDYVRAWGATVGNPAVANFNPPTFLTVDRLFRNQWSDRALFGELTIGLRDRLDLSLGFRFAQDDSSSTEYLPADGFRPAAPGTKPVGDLFAVAGVIRDTVDQPDFGTISTPRIALAYRPAENVFLYTSYAEGYTSSTVVTSAVVPNPITLDPEIITTRELGLRSDLLDQRLRFNATLFSSRWDGLRVPKLIEDPANPGQLLPLGVPTSDGVAEASGLEVELVYAPRERWDVDLSLGLLKTEYLDIGDPPTNGTGLQPGIPLQYAPERSFSLGARYRLPVARGGELLFAGNYGWMDEYQRAAARDLQTKHPDGSSKPEPAYGVLNARIVYQPAERWQLSLFGTNLTNEWYVNGGIDGGLVWGYDFGTIGRPREIGLGLRFVLE